MAMDHHSYRQHISEELDGFEAGLHYEEEEENSLQYRQIRVLNHIALLFGDSYNDYISNSINDDYNDDNLGDNDDRSTPPWQQGDVYDSFINEYISTRHLARSSSSSLDRYRQHCDTTNNNSISGNKGEIDLHVDPQIRGPFVTTHLPSLLSPTAATLPSSPPDVAAVKRGPGRPRGSSKKRPPSPHSPDVIGAVKRGPGRPKCSSSSMKQPLSPSPLPSDAVAAARTGPRRPKRSSSSSFKTRPIPSPHPPDTDAVTVKRGPGRPKGPLSCKNRSTSISSIITPTVTTRARARAQSICRVRLRVTDPSLASASSSFNANVTATKAVNAASILALRPVLPVMVMPKRRGPGRPKGSKNRRRAHY